MKLFYNEASPYARKVCVLIDEKGARDQVEIVSSGLLSPVSPNATVIDANPLGKVPTLVLDNGESVFDSRVICEYLDAALPGRSLFPSGDARWASATLHALADGLLDAALVARYEGFLRPEERRWPEWIEGQKNKFRRAVDELEQQADGFGDDFDIGQIAAACALAYIDFRFPEEEWRDGHPKLAAWYSAAESRPSMERTKPVG